MYAATHVASYNFLDAQAHIFLQIGYWHLLDSPGEGGGWSLNIANEDEVEPLGYYKSPFDAADDVCTGNTGLGMWDKRAKRKAPATLFEWTNKTVRESKPQQ